MEADRTVGLTERRAGRGDGVRGVPNPIDREGGWMHVKCLEEGQARQGLAQKGSAAPLTPSRPTPRQTDTLLTCTSCTSILSVRTYVGKYLFHTDLATYNLPSGRYRNSTHTPRNTPTEFRYSSRSGWHGWVEWMMKRSASSHAIR